MKLDYLLKLLTEAPIQNLEFRGDWDKDKNQGWDKVSRKLFKNPISVEKMKKMWSKTGANFDIYMLKTDSAKNYREIGKVSPEFVKDRLNLDITPNPENITIIFTNNFGQQRIPATPWTLAHRFGHSIKNSYNFKEYQDSLKSVFEYVREYVYEIPYPIFGSAGLRPPSNNASVIQKRISNSLGTFRSARENKVINIFEFSYEIFAQYLITGKIEFNNLPDTLPVRFVFGRPEGFKKKLSDEEIKSDLFSYRNSLEYYCDQVLIGAVGNIYVM